MEAEKKKKNDAAGHENGNGHKNENFNHRRHNKSKPPYHRPSLLPENFPCYSADQLNYLKVSQLQSIAKTEGVRHFWSMPRHQLILEIIKQQLRRGSQVNCRGVIELTPESHGYLRNENFHLQSRCSDPFIPVQVIRQNNLYGGLEVSGNLRPPRSGDRHLVLNSIDLIEGDALENFEKRKSFEHLTALHPEERLFMEITGDDNPDHTRRVIDVIAPIGKGQRGIIVAPPRVGKTIMMKQMVQSIEKNHPDVVVIVLLIDERPEEVTDIQESIAGNVVASTFDEKPVRHVQVATTAINRAKVLVENGKDVVLFLDSITRLARAYNQSAGNSGRLMSGGMDSAALQKTKQFFGTGRNFEDGGSLTILGTALVQTGSRMDEVIFEEFKGTGNMELYLDRDIANHRIYPAINVLTSGTRKDDLFMPKEEFEIVSKIRKTLHAMTPLDAITRLLDQMNKYKSNAEFLMSIRNSLG